MRKIKLINPKEITDEINSIRITFILSVNANAKGWEI